MMAIVVTLLDNLFTVVYTKKSVCGINTGYLGFFVLFVAWSWILCLPLPPCKPYVA